MNLRNVLAATLTAVSLGVAAPAGADGTTSCPDYQWRAADWRQGSFTVGGVAHRHGPSNSCGSYATGSTSHRLQYDCWKWGADGYKWSHIYNLSLGVGGWVRSNTLSNGGSQVGC